MWADPGAPVDMLRTCPERVVAFLTDEYNNSLEPLRQVLANPRLPAAVLTALLKRLPHRSRQDLIWDLAGEPPSAWVRLADAFTPASLSRAISRVDQPWRYPAWRPEELTDVAGILRAFTVNRHPKVRALAAEAFPVDASARHRYSDGTVSAVRLAADPEPAVRRGLARNPYLRDLPDDAPGLAVRQQLLDDSDPTVRATAVRQNVALTHTDVLGLMNALYSRFGEDLGLTPHAASEPVEPWPKPVLAVTDPLDDPAPHVRAAAVPSISLTDDGRWQRVMTDPDAGVRAAGTIRGWSTPPHVWLSLAHDPEVRVRRAVARSRWAPPAVLRQLTGDHDPSIAEQARARV